jgi:peptide/nickel transport system substrate-binding protein
MDILKKFDVVGLRMLRDLLIIGIKNCADNELIRYGRDFVDYIDYNLPEKEVKSPVEMDVISSGARASNYGGTVTIGHSSKPDIINPILTSETISTTLMNLIFSCLVGYNGAHRPVPDLAKSWQISKDGLKWTFFLRDNVEFHDGHPLTAKDVEFTYSAVMNPKNTSPKANRYNMIDKIETEGDYIVRFVLKNPFAPFIHRLGLPIAPKHLLEKGSIRKSMFNRHPVGSGPFKLAEWTKDDTVILEANNKYYQKGRPVLERLIFKSYPERRIAVQEIARGKMDIALNLASSDLLFVGKYGPFRVYPTPTSSSYVLFFNLNDPLFSDIRVRKALDHAIDKESIVKNQLKGYSEICTGPFNVNSWAYNTKVQPAYHNVNISRELLEEAGFRYSHKESLIYDKDDKPLEISITLPNISDGLERVALSIRAQLMKVGINTKLVYETDNEGIYNKQFQTILTNMCIGTDPDFQYDIWHSSSKDANLASYKNRIVDELFDQGRQIVDLEKRKKIYRKIHTIIHDDYPAVFLAAGCEFIGSNYSFKNVQFNSMNHFISSAKDWQIVDTKKSPGRQARENIANQT